MISDALRSLAAEPYVLLTTFRRDGTAVSTPVWIVLDGDRLLVTTGAATGKVKRLAHTSRVELTACDRVGFISAGAVATQAVALSDPSSETRAALDAALLAKYGEAFERIRAARGDVSPVMTSTAIVISSPA